MLPTMRSLRHDEIARQEPTTIYLSQVPVKVRGTEDDLEDYLALPASRHDVIEAASVQR
jgi:hypothetical protein